MSFQHHEISPRVVSLWFFSSVSLPLEYLLSQQWSSFMLTSSSSLGSFSFYLWSQTAAPSTSSQATTSSIIPFAVGSKCTHSLVVCVCVCVCVCFELPPGLTSSLWIIYICKMLHEIITEIQGGTQLYALLTANKLNKKRVL